MNKSKNLEVARRKCPLRPGDTVSMVDCPEAEKYSGRLWTVDSMPWICCGSILVKLEGYAGGFDVSCLRKVAPLKEAVGPDLGEAAITGA